jgi:DNA replication and repair protein RecF
VNLEKLSLINYKNIPTAALELSPKMNCFIGHNGVGKTNVLDAVYFLSFCHSSNNPVDSQVIRHGQDYMMLEGVYSMESGKWRAESEEREVENDALVISCGMKRGTKKHFKRNKKEYKRLSEHIGLIPLVMVAPSDTLLIDGGSEERRRLMDVVIAQQNRLYMESLSRYNKALTQRNTLLKQDEEPDADVLAIFEEQMAAEGERIFQQRTAFTEELTPLFQTYYEQISGGREKVSLTYQSHCQRGPLLEVIQRDRWKDRAIGYSLHGVHRDDLEMLLDGHPMKREGSQGQLKTFVIALKLAQFELLKRSMPTVPILLLDDIFDKLDAERVEQIVKLVGSDDFGQIFITDTNRDHLDHILSTSSHDYKLFTVNNGEICLNATSNL